MRRNMQCNRLLKSKYSTANNRESKNEHLMDKALAALCGSHASFTWKASFRADRPEVKHVGRLSEMLSSLQKVGLLLKAEKTTTATEEREFLVTLWFHRTA
ncbi:hypothetical protein T06_8832 [Trichinella sp. T6]|nr:hypothetical protein T06_8832 [Trichinella sp. T6]